MSAKKEFDESGASWISVKHKLPKEDTEVIVARYYTDVKHHRHYYVETASRIGNNWYSYSDEYKVNRSCHSIPFAWMPMPEPPTGLAPRQHIMQASGSRG